MRQRTNAEVNAARQKNDLFFMKSRWRYAAYLALCLFVAGPYCFQLCRQRLTAIKIVLSVVIVIVTLLIALNTFRGWRYWYQWGRWQK